MKKIYFKNWRSLKQSGQEEREPSQLFEVVIRSIHFDDDRTMFRGEQSNRKLLEEKQLGKGRRKESFLGVFVPSSTFSQ